MEFVHDRMTERCFCRGRTNLRRALILAIALAGLARGDDATRKEFLIGGGMGFGVSSWRSYSNAYGNTDKGRIHTGFSFGTDMRFGKALGDRYELFFHVPGNWYWSSDVAVLNGLAGPGLTRFARTEMPALFVTLSLGCAYRLFPFNGYWNGKFWSIGWGVNLASGFELWKGRRCEFSLGFGSPRRPRDKRKAVDPFTWSVEEGDLKYVRYCDVQEVLTVGVKFLWLRY